MTDKIMAMFDEAVMCDESYILSSIRSAMYKAIKAEQDYARAVISERDELKALMYKALDERDYFIGERDKLTMVHAERTVERDRLREAAQRALEAFNRTIWDSPPGITTKRVERMESIALAGAVELQNALRKELGE